MIIESKKHVQFRGTTCIASYDYYATATGAVVCRTTYTPVEKSLRYLRGHKTVQLLNLAFALNVSDCMMLLGLSLDMPEAAALFDALAGSNLRPDDCSRCIADYVNQQ